MTVSEAIRRIQEHKQLYTISSKNRHGVEPVMLNHALDMAIDALKSTQKDDSLDQDKYEFSTYFELIQNRDINFLSEFILSMILTCSYNQTDVEQLNNAQINLLLRNINVLLSSRPTPDDLAHSIEH
jgi:hypothetical protein